MLKNRINQKKSEKIRKFLEHVANFFEKSLVRCLDFPKISTSLKIFAYKPLLIKKTKCMLPSEQSHSEAKSSQVRANWFCLHQHDALLMLKSLMFHYLHHRLTHWLWNFQLAHLILYMLFEQISPRLKKSLLCRRKSMFFVLAP